MENYFRDALHNFIFEEAGGGAIRHLTDRGYTARQVADSLSFPMPYEKVREAYTKHLLESGILLAEKPMECKKREKVEYVREYDKYGKPSFRRVVIAEDDGRGGMPGGRTDREQGGLSEKRACAGGWKEMELSEFLLLYKEGTGGIRLSGESEHKETEKNAYIACNFGVDGIEEMLQGLDKGQREYIQGIRWTRRTMYHLLDRRMLGIAMKLREEEQDITGKVYIRH